MKDNATKRILYLDGLTCADCAGKIENRIASLEGIDQVSLNFLAQTLLLVISDQSLLPSLSRQASNIVTEIEPNVTVSFAPPKNTEKKTEKRIVLRRIGLVLGFVLLLVGLILPLSPSISFSIFALSYLLVGGQVILRAFQNITRGQIFGEHLLMSIATLGAFVIGEYPEGIAVMLFFQIGEAFQRLSVKRSRRSITALMDIRPDFANLQTENGLQQVSPEEVAVGEIIIVKPGEKVPLDGIVTKGQASIDVSALTGESLPKNVVTGDTVLSGSINKNGLISLEAAKVFSDSTVSKILDLVQNAASNKSQTENFITKFARYYTPVVVFLSLALAVIPSLFFGGIWSEWTYRALVFLVISCPCALIISVPLTYFSGIGGASRSGILIKGSNYLEALNNVDTVVFDKTGTLTKGVFEVTDVVPRGGLNQEELLAQVALAECNSNHPIADSIRESFTGAVDKESITKYEELAGFGLYVEVRDKVILVGNAKLMENKGIDFETPSSTGTIVHIAISGKYAGYLVLSDVIKPDSAEAIAGLKRLGVKRVVMLTGDSKATAACISADIGLDNYFAELLPQNKVYELERLEKNKSTKGSLIFVGDGINDAPVLARSDIGIAMGGIGSDAAIEAADVVLMTDEPSKIITGIKIAINTHRIALENIVFALSIKGIVLVLGALGMADMWMAVFADVGVTLLAILNAMRAMRIAQ